MIFIICVNTQATCNTKREWESYSCLVSKDKAERKRYSAYSCFLHWFVCLLS